MDLVHMATCFIHWAILWRIESTKIKQNQGVDFDGIMVVMVVMVNTWTYLRVTPPDGGLRGW